MPNALVTRSTLGETLEFPVDATEASGGDEDFDYIDYLMEDSS